MRDNPLVLFVTATERERSVVKAIVANRLTSDGRPAAMLVQENGLRIFLNESNIDSRNFEWDCRIVSTDMTNIAAANTLLYHIGKTKPDLVIFIGCCGGIKDCRIGDIIVPTRVHYYEYAKEFKRDDISVIQPRHLEETIFEQSLEIAQEIKDNMNWKKYLLNSRFLKDMSISFGPICSGEKVLANSDGVILNMIRTQYPSAIAVDMESYGIVKMIYKNFRGIRVFVFRAVSDMCGNKNAAAANGVYIDQFSDGNLLKMSSYMKRLAGDIDTLHDDDRQRIAVNHASAFAVRFTERYLHQNLPRARY